jgi:hypothetical protein
MASDRPVSDIARSPLIVVEVVVAVVVAVMW